MAVAEAVVITMIIILVLKHKGKINHSSVWNPNPTNIKDMKRYCKMINVKIL